MNDAVLEKIISKVVEDYFHNKEINKSEDESILVEVSARHIHLSQVDVERLFGEGYKLTQKRELSQPGQFLAQERVNIVTYKGEFKDVAILGPSRKNTQVEISQTDARILGIKVPLRASGDIDNSESVCIMSKNKMIEACNSTIIAKNHIHMNTKDLEKYDLKDGQIVKVKINSNRPVTFEDVSIRANDNFSLAMHIDFDEANACMFEKGDSATIIK